ncbi:hypothetical protein GCM10017653_02400 [Ancylobacter defluvii]|uniref:Cell division and transport-associated protein TolA n=2 Tax=Ancylobacter defluvii TaxID=1282440 RepID=A0A9W6JR17_9HYPH|nr:cell envelope biogenesis protein TolA [Ancylobacter defluvii]GLK82171.1 hypothetical protein GCM10017653_02400 [Ancylobacter defluvii]
MRAGLVSSAALHIGIIGFMAISFASPSPYEIVQESMPIDIVSDSELSKMMAGKKDAPKAEAPKPVVEKIDAPKQAENLDAKVSEKPEIKAAKEAAAPPPPPPPPPDAKPEPTPPQQQAEAKPPEPKPAPQQPQAKPEPAPPKDAESMAAKPPEPKKDEPKPAQTAQAAPPPPPAPPKKPKDIPPKVVQAPPKEQRDFNPNQIAALLNKQDPRRQAALGDTMNSMASLGATRGDANSLSQTEIDALRAYIRQFWSLPAGGVDVERITVSIRFILGPDRRLQGAPQLVEVQSAGNPYAKVVQETAMRAVNLAAHQDNPFPMLRPEKYETWRDLTVDFNPSMLNY